MNFFERNTNRIAIIAIGTAFAFSSTSSAFAAEARSNTKGELSSKIPSKRTTIPRVEPLPVMVPTPVMIKFAINNGAASTTRSC